MFKFMFCNRHLIFDYEKIEVYTDEFINRKIEDKPISPNLYRLVNTPPESVGPIVERTYMVMRSVKIDLYQRYWDKVAGLSTNIVPEPSPSAGKHVKDVPMTDLKNCYYSEWTCSKGTTQYQGIREKGTNKKCGFVRSIAYEMCEEATYLNGK